MSVVVYLGRITKVVTLSLTSLSRKLRGGERGARVEIGDRVYKKNTKLGGLGVQRILLIHVAKGHIGLV